MASAHGELSVNERRLAARRAVNVGTAWSDGRRARHGEVLDTSSHGVFLKPGWAPSESFMRGDAIELRCRVDDLDIDLHGEVCWVGHSADHDVDGIGLRIYNTDALSRLVDGLHPH